MVSVSHGFDCPGLTFSAVSFWLVRLYRSATEACPGNLDPEYEAPFKQIDLNAWDWQVIRWSCIVLLGSGVDYT